MEQAGKKDVSTISVQCIISLSHVFHQLAYQLLPDMAPQCLHSPSVKA